MAITLKEMFELTREHYRLKLLAGQNDMDYVVTWAHMVEDPSVTSYFWGNELVVTSGFNLKNSDDMIQLVNLLSMRRCAGLVINIGRYFQQIPSDVVKVCEQLHFPLITMPWEIYITEFVQDCCSLINQSGLEEQKLIQAVQRVIASPQEAGSCRKMLDETFSEVGGFQILSIFAEQLNEEHSQIARHRSVLRLHTALRSFDFVYLIFRQDKRIILLINGQNTQQVVKAARRILEAVHTALPDVTPWFGIGDPVQSYDQLSDAYQTSIAAVRRAELQQQPIVCFRDMGFYKLLYSVPHDTLLQNYYKETLAPLLDADGGKFGSITETLLRYLLTDGSLQTVAEQMYTHRNTVYYRMGKIRELLDCPLESQSQRLPYLIAYHAGVILRLIPDLQA